MRGWYPEGSMGQKAFDALHSDQFLFGEALEEQALSHVTTRTCRRQVLPKTGGTPSMRSTSWKKSETLRSKPLSYCNKTPWREGRRGGRTMRVRGRRRKDYILGTFRRSLVPWENKIAHHPPGNTKTAKCY